MSRLRRRELSHSYSYIHLPSGKSLIAWLLLAISVLYSSHAFGQQEADEEVPVIVSVAGVGSIELTALIREERVALPVSDIFTFIRIRNTIGEEFKEISGYFLEPSNTYIIDGVQNKIVYQGKSIELPAGAIARTNTNLYLDAEQFSIFGLKTEFNFRSLTLNIVSAKELPVVREMRLENMRRNVDHLKGEFITDTTIRSRNPFSDIGILNWNIITSQQQNGKSTARATLGFGGIVAGGEFSGAINVAPNEKFDPARQFYMWRLINNENKVVRQVLLGKIGPSTIVSLFGPIVGVQVNNRLTYNRRVFSTYRINRVTTPGWDVELYVNQVLVGYRKADSGGAVSFDIPLVYGTSDITLRFYGPFGESVVRQETVSVPYQLLPVGQLEYSASAGMVEDKQYSQFSQGVLKYGLARNLTIGAGAEYLSSITATPVIPFVNASVVLSSKLLLYNELAARTRFRSQLSYRLPANAQLDINYTKYEKGQKAVNVSALEERRATLSMPVRIGKFSATSFFTFNQVILSSNKNSIAEILLGAPVRGVNIQLTTYGLFADHQKTVYYSNLNLMFRLPMGFRLSPTAQIRYNDTKLMSGRASLEKTLFRNSVMSAFYERNLVSNLTNFGINFIHDFNLAQVNVSANSLNKRFTLIESFRGGMIYDARTNYSRFNSRINVGRGALIIIPFLDINCNGVKDMDEPRVSGLKCSINGGYTSPESKDTTIRVLDLEPYNYHYLRIEKFSFDNIAWQIRNSNIKIAVEPNHFKKLYVPVAVLGEASGMIFIDDGSGTKGQGQILVNFYQHDSLVARVVSEPDGYFSYVGLAPGNYTVKMDGQQLQRVSLQATPASLDIEIKANPEGDVLEGLEFTLKRKSESEQ